MSKNSSIIIRNIDFNLNDDLKIDIKFNDTLIYENDIANIKKDESNRNYFVVNAINNTGYYKGFIMDKDKTLKNLNDVKKMMRK